MTTTIEDALILAAWTDKDSMTVLMDRLLETGEIETPTNWGASKSEEQAIELYNHESEVRDWILKRLNERVQRDIAERRADQKVNKVPEVQLELRITGRWPWVLYVVHAVAVRNRNHTPMAWRQTTRRVCWSDTGIVAQPRLLLTQEEATLIAPPSLVNYTPLVNDRMGLGTKPFSLPWAPDGSVANVHSDRLWARAAWEAARAITSE